MGEEVFLTEGRESQHVATGEPRQRAPVGGRDWGRLHEFAGFYEFYVTLTGFWASNIHPKNLVSKDQSLNGSPGTPSPAGRVPGLPPLETGWPAVISCM